MSKVLYIGDSCAVRSFDTLYGTESNYTNLYKELNLDVVDLSHHAISNLDFLKLVNSQSNYKGIIWIYSEPISDIDTLGIATKQDFLKSDDFISLRKEANKSLLEKISQLNVPVALIGSSSDIEDCEYNNITVIHHSWRRFLSTIANTTLDFNWGADIAHRWIAKEYPDIKPSKNLVLQTSKTIMQWKSLEKAGLLCYCHPTKKGNELFAKEIGSSVQSWLNDL